MAFLTSRRRVRTIRVPWRAAILLAAILIGELVVLEAALRVFGKTEAAAEFQSLFIPDDRIGYRLRPGTAVTYYTSEFRTDMVINETGVRDHERIPPKAAGERRVLVLGDSYVFAVQVAFRDTFGERLEAQLNALGSGHTWRVINGGVQGYGPIEEWLFYRDIASAFEPDVVLIVVSVANDAIEAFDARSKLSPDRRSGPAAAHNTSRVMLRRVIRASTVLQLARQRVNQFRARLSASVAERPLATYLEHPPPFVSEGLQAATQAFAHIVKAARDDGARVAFILMPARFQTHDIDFEGVSRIAAGAGGTLQRHAATERFATALRPLGEPMLDLLPIFASAADPPSLHFTHNTHLSKRGHEVTARAILRFLQSERLLQSEPH